MKIPNMTRKSNDDKFNGITPNPVADIVTMWAEKNALFS